MIQHLICISLLIIAYKAAKMLVKAESTSADCDNAVKEAQNLINQKFITNEQH